MILKKSGLSPEEDGFNSGALPMLIVLEKEHRGFDDENVLRKKVDLRAVEHHQRCFADVDCFEKKLSFAASMMMASPAVFRRFVDCFKKEHRSFDDVDVFRKRLSFAPMKMMASTAGLR